MLIILFGDVYWDLIEQMLAHVYPCNAKVAYNELEVVAEYT